MLLVHNAMLICIAIDLASLDLFTVFGLHFVAGQILLFQKQSHGPTSIVLSSYVIFNKLYVVLFNA